MDLTGFKSASVGSPIPQKKMKKRKELNALIGLGESKRKKTKKGGHRLLRTEPPGTESESSSDDDEFNNLGTVAAFGKSYTQCCNFCYPLFLFIILAGCVMACAGLIWMQIALKEDLDSLKEKLHTMESSQKVSSHEIPKLSEDLKNKQKKLDYIENGDKGLGKLWSNLTEINRKISLLDSAVNHLKANIKSASDLINLPTTVEELQKSVATIGSTLTSVQHDVKTMQTVLEGQKKESDHMKMSEDVVDVDLKEAVVEVNKTQELYHSWSDNQILTLRTAVSNLTQRVASLEQSPALTAQLSDSVEVIETEPPGETGTVETLNMTSSDDVDGEKLGKSASSTTAKPTVRNQRPRYLTPNRSKRDTGTAHPKTLSLPGVSTLKDLEEIFQRAGATEQGMSYQDLKKHFGASNARILDLGCFDKNKDGRYSLTELKAAVNL